MNSHPAPVSSGVQTDLPSSLEDPWARVRQRLLRHARMMVHEPALAEDLVQEALIAMLERPDTHNGQASFTTWATAILKNKIADWYRSPHQRRRVQVSEEAQESGDDPTNALYDAQGSYRETVPAWQQPDGQEAQRQMMTVMEACMQRLPAQAGKVFMLREWLGFETPEICERLGLTADNCRMILHRARMGLRQCMTVHGHSAGSVS